MLKHFDFECISCSHNFDDYVEGVEGIPEECPACKKAEGFKKLANTCAIPHVIVIGYPGAKRLKAGYVHTHGDRPAEKKGSQVSMYVGKKG